jgi:hypothetical protein
LAKLQLRATKGSGPMAMKSNGVRLSSRTFVVAFVLLLAGAILLAAGWWLRPIADAQQAVGDGRLQQALESYRVAERRFTSVPLARRFMPDLHDLVITNELAVMYALKQYDEVIDKAGATGTPGSNFWAGCALFSKGDIAFLTPDKRMQWMSQAQQEFRRAVEKAPSDFDAKFNYEVTAKVIAGVEKFNPPTPTTDFRFLAPSDEQTPKKVG